MRPFAFALLAFGCAFVAACASDEDDPPQHTLYGCTGEDRYDSAEIDWLMGTWVEGVPSDRTDRLTFERGPRRFTQEISRQVGADDKPNIPYPTVCRYRQVSETLCLNEITDARSPSPNGTAPLYRLTFMVSHLELIEHPENDAACGEYVQLQRSRIEKGMLQYSEEFAQSTDGHLVVDGDERLMREP